MTARTLRILISAALVFGIFFYLLSVQVNQTLPVKTADEGLLGGPVPGLTQWQLKKFEEGRSLFSKHFGIKDGLGPLYNADSCSSCHGGDGTTGGAGPSPATSSVTRIGKRKTPGRFAKEELRSVLGKLEEKDIDNLTNEGGPVLVCKSVSPDPDEPALKDCKIDPAKVIPKDAELHGKRYAGPLYGLGFVNSIDDLILNLQMQNQWRTSAAQIKGKIVHVDPTFGEWWVVGRFGKKCQEANLINFIAEEMAVEIGLSNQFARHSISCTEPDKFPDCIKAVCPADPNDDGSLLNKINFYLTTLAPPPRAPITPEATKGAQIFQNLKCAACHIAEQKTAAKVMVINPDGPPIKLEEIAADKPGNKTQLHLITAPKYIELRALENKSFSPYSDFLIHDMGAGLSDGLAQNGSSGSEWRTTPLWGLRHRKFYLHDGRAKNLTEAILAHGGQAAESNKSYAKLSEQEKKDLLAFLNSL